MLDAGFWSFRWLGQYPQPAEAMPALGLGLLEGHGWLLPIGLALLAPLLVMRRPAGDRILASTLAWSGGLGLLWTFGQGFLIGLKGPLIGVLAGLGGPIAQGQAGLGWGAVVVVASLLAFLAYGLAQHGACRGDGFVVGAILAAVLLIGLFVFFPVGRALASALQDNDGNFVPGLFVRRILVRDIWGMDCLYSELRCGVAFNTVVLAILAGLGSTLLGLAFALVAVRSAFRYKRLLRAMTVLPIITPPFVISLAIIVLFGRTGLVTGWLDALFGLGRSRWIYGLPGVLISQLLSQTPLAFLVLIGVLEGVGPSLEEATQTLGASRWHCFRTVTWPLIRPGVANAALLGFVESMADFGNPLVLGGNFDVLSVKIFFAVVGAQHDPGRAAVLAVVLLCFTLGAFWLQNQWLGKRVYVTVTGKGDSGLPTPLPRGISWACYLTTLPWVAFTLVVYAIILIGGFVRDIGRADYTVTWRHFITAFNVETTERGLLFSGSAWDSFWTTLEVSAISAPLTAAMGLLTAYLLSRQRFAGQRFFEFGTMLSFAIPGTVIGVSYIIAFNVPPIEITGTALILVICFVFRNMPVGVRAGLAALSQIDRSLDEASLTLGARTTMTLRRVILPLLRPAVVATLVFSFVHAMTAVSAIIFLVSARYNMATSYIVNRVEAGEIALAIAYSSVLILVMALAIVVIQLVVGKRRLGRRGLGDLGLAGAA
ncbi:MAG: iron ABC transporter permease [Proteobacteria bacterium]|nr:iron ABC transporter permease [Pseudomonadota bacterium]MBI3498344.1 iron ABC transporter permease [Pseudomonadota bacterium]